jgi:hypothetical protein
MEPKLFGHDRGCLFELYHAGRYAVSGIPEHFVQHNLALSATASWPASSKPEPQGKLVTVLRGCALDDDAYNPADELALRWDDPRLGIDGAVIRRWRLGATAMAAFSQNSAIASPHPKRSVGILLTDVSGRPAARSSLARHGNPGQPRQPRFRQARAPSRLDGIATELTIRPPAGPQTKRRTSP